MKSIYAFDVDETLEVSGGPIPLELLIELHNKGHIVGICGNWALFCSVVPDWQKYISFLGSMEMTKDAFLRQLKTYIRADNYFMVGNIKGVSGVSDDKGAADLAKWTFIKESEWESIPLHLT